MFYPLPRILRLCRRNNVLKHAKIYRRCTSNAIENDDKPHKTKDFKYLLQQYKDKIIFNSYLEHEKLELGYFKYYVKSIKRAKQEQVRDYKEKSLPALPVALQYYIDRDNSPKEQNEMPISEPEGDYQLPFANATEIKYDESSNAFQETVKPVVEEAEHQEFDRSNIDKWMTNYEHFDDSKLISTEEEGDEVHWSKCYGTPDPSARVTSVPCGGCGALLHCSDPAIPGYLPSEILKNRSRTDLKLIECQRCHFLKEYNIALDVSVQPEEYEKLLQSVRHVKSLVLVMIDLLDFPCSIWPGIVDIIGTERPIIIVANKVDLIPGDSIGYLKRIKESLITEINKTKLGEANIKHVALISAKTGYGVENLISAMFKTWLYKGDVFLIGTTNVGKSSLFNALLQSDYCKVHAVDIVKRATVSRWPGTTLNLLKFPINRPSGWKIHQRTQRLESDARLMQVEKEIRKEQIGGKVPTETPALIGHIGRTFTMSGEVPSKDGLIDKQNLIVMDEKHELFAKSKWLYDTPGVIHPDQVLSLLSTEELLLTIPKKLIRPQTYYLHKGSTIFIGGLARVDFVEGATPCRFTIFCSENLPITITKTEDAGEVYDKFVGTEIFAAPSGGVERLKKWPGLKDKDTVLKFQGEGPKWCCGDIVLSSIGWVSVTAKMRMSLTVRAWTPEGRGIHRRYPSLLPYSVNLKGKRVRDTPAYMVGKVFSEEE